MGEGWEGDRLRCGITGDESGRIEGVRGWRGGRIGIPEHTSSRRGVRGRGGSYVYIYVLTYVKRVKRGPIRLGRGRLFTPGVGCERGVVRACRAVQMGPGGAFRTCEAAGCGRNFFFSEVLGLQERR